MLRDEPTIRPNLYRLPRDPIALQILIPAFRQAVSVHGAFGWFTAGWIANLAHGLASYLARDVQPIEMTIAPVLFEPEYSVVGKVVADPQSVAQQVATLFENAKSPSASALSHHAVDCMAWMLAHGRLVLRIAKLKPESNYHPKVWLFSDGVDQVAVRGSANATGRAYRSAIEHMDVDCTWDNHARVQRARDMVLDWAYGRDEQIEAVYDLPDAVKRAIIRLAPDRAPIDADYRMALAQSNHEAVQDAAGEEPASMYRIPSELRWQEGRYSHQGEAVLAWEKQGRRGVVAMATGAGKTISALIAGYRAWQEHNGPFLMIVSAPSTPLVLQWKTECEKFGLRPVLPTIQSGRREKHQAIGNTLLRLRRGDAGHIETMIVTNHLMTTPEFHNALTDAKERVPDVQYLHIGDEAHTLGSRAFIATPPEFIDLRLGLSATPERQYDDEGTKQLFRYFGPTAYEFGLSRAIGFCLVHYDYYVHRCELSMNELDDFLELSNRIGQLIARSGGAVDFSDDRLTALLVQRRGIVETAASKLNVLRRLLETQREGLRHTLVYTSSKNPDQLLAAKRVVADLGIVASQVTEAETANRTQLQVTLNAFADGDYDVLLAKRVLDEGVDIPQTRQAILLASSSVEREWIQRRGRVLRPAPGKSHAVIHDLVALPPPRAALRYDDGVLQFISSELDRVRAFARHARNRRDVLEHISQVHDTHFKD